jgi:predicted ester cyclase
MEAHTDPIDDSHAIDGLSVQAAKRLCVDSMTLMVTGELSDFERVVHPQATNREAKDEPPAALEPGPNGFYATALWLRAAFADLAFEVHEAIVDGDLVVVHNTMSGRHHAPMVQYTDGEVDAVFPPTGRRFATTQTHWFRIADGKVIEHWANRDDIGTARQLGWVPPTPLYLLRMAAARRRARRRHRQQPHTLAVASDPVAPVISVR